MHFTNQYLVLVGVTSKSRKGSSWGNTKQILELGDATWLERVYGGASTGEGLIYQVRDAAKIKDGWDPGVTDKRLCDVEPEFGRVLQVAGRESNTLSAVFRQAWDDGDLRILTRTTPLKATGAHLSVIGHITKDELARLMNDTIAANGFGNRFLWVCCRRSKVLPESGGLPSSIPESFGEELKRACEWAEYLGALGPVRRDTDARALWLDRYPDLSEGKPGLLGAMTSRAEAHVMRLATIYAVLDLRDQIHARHLQAALELWRYAEASARFIFGDALGDPTADELLTAIRQQPRGMTRTEIRDYFGRNQSSREIGRALAKLSEHGLATMTTVKDGGGRPAECWKPIFSPVAVLV